MSHWKMKNYFFIPDCIKMVTYQSCRYFGSFSLTFLLMWQVRTYMSWEKIIKWDVGSTWWICHRNVNGLFCRFLWIVIILGLLTSTCEITSRAMNTLPKFIQLAKVLWRHLLPSTKSTLMNTKRSRSWTFSWGAIVRWSRTF